MGGEMREYLFKIIIVGDLSTGKTSIIKRYVHDIFSMRCKATVGVDFALKTLVMEDGQMVVRLQLWDIGGQERFQNTTRPYYKEAVGAFVVFDVTRGEALDGAAKWKQDIDTKVKLPDGKDIPVVLLGNKCDLAKEGTCKDNEEMVKYCKENGFVGWFKTSAKNNTGIEDAFNFLVKKILEAESTQLLARRPTEGTVSLEDSNRGEGGRGGCCLS